MKKNININLCGVIYAIDEDACQLLEQYLDNIKSYFSRKEGGEEIADDIEHRIAELFWEKKQQGVEAIDVMTVKTILKQIGNPEQMTDGEKKADTESAPESDTSTSTSEEKKASGETRSSGIYGKQESKGPAPKKRLFRDTRDKKLGGVLSGLAAYLGMNDPLALRIIYVVLTLFLAPTFGSLHWAFSHIPFVHVPHFLFFNIFIVIYVFAWILIPEAKTAEDRLMMKGKAITPETIKEEVIEDEELKKKVVSPRSDETSSRGCADGCLSVFAFLVKAFLFFILAIVFLSVVFALLVALFATTFATDLPWVAELEGLSFGFKMLAVVVVLAILGIPLYILYRMVFCKEKMKSGALLLLLLLWLAACFAPVPLLKHCAQEMDLDDVPGWHFNSQNGNDFSRFLWNMGDWRVEGHHTETFTEPDGTVVTVRHNTITTRDGKEVRIDTIRTPANLVPELTEGEDFTDGASQDD
ncbi:MAG: PspC domain-containing protein [Bacteroidales bacterium]|nr:PspC domain-containing protein [Bacteroidales bacterium]